MIGILRKLNIRAILTVPLTVIFIYSSYMVIHKVIDYKESEQLYDELKEKYGAGSIVNADIRASEAIGEEVIQTITDDAAINNEEDLQQNIRQKRVAVIKKEVEEKIAREKEEEYQQSLKINVFKKSPELLKINNDLAAWITIPHTNLDYPVVKTTDNEFYLKHDFKKRQNSAGCIFMDYTNNGEFTDNNTILYGHNMKNDTMFHDITQYKEKDFFNANPIIYVYTPRQVQRWQVFSVYVTDVNFNYTTANFTSENEFQDFINTIKQKSRFRSSVKVSSNDKILTLSTCSYEFDNARTVVHAKLIK